MTQPTSVAPSVCVMVNKTGGTLRPSESFLRAHMERLPGRVTTLLGHPGARRIGLNGETFLLSQSLVARGWRWGIRRAGVASLAAQDTRSLVRYLKKTKTEVVLAEYGPTAVSVRQACQDAGVPLVSHFHGWDAYVLASDPTSREEYKQLFQDSEAIVAVSRHQKTHLESLGAPSEKVVWNPCGAEPQADRVATPAEAPPVFISVGRPAPKKATIVGLLAFAQVAELIPEARLQLVGGGLDTLLHQAALALGVREKVEFIGALPHEEVLERLAATRCYLHPSVTAPDGDMEGTPVSVMEAMAAGLPVVSTRHGGILDLLDGTGAGTLVDEYDARGTAQAMLAYARDPEHAARAGREGRRLLTERWSMERSLDGLAEILRLAAARDAEGIRRMAARPWV